ncbi:phospholipase [Ceratobasidium sp. AG-Ba]|nr:phospholipase [Ceratobasidium sp. AG-Ba]
MKSSLGQLRHARAKFRPPIRLHASIGTHRVASKQITAATLLTVATLTGGSFYLFRSATNCEEITGHPGDKPRRWSVLQSPEVPIEKDTSQDSVISSDGVSSWSLAASLLTSWAWPESFDWARNRIGTLVLELSRGPGSLWNEIVDSPPSLVDHPEYDWDAEVRLGDELCLPERAFLRSRRRRMRAAFAELFGVPITEIDERDLPTVAIAGSGGGFRAMVNTFGALKGAQETGILDCTSYVAGISGSCWALGILYSGIVGGPSPQDARSHLVSRIQTPYLDTSTLDMLVTPPTNKYLLSGFLHKATAPGWGGISLTDIYGTLLSARLLVPDESDKLDPRCLSLHQFRRFVDDGSYPMPIMTAISRHLREPLEAQEVETKKQERKTYGPSRRSRLRKEAEELEAQARWLWFEWSPYEVGCDELGAWIPSWALGRRFRNGQNVERRPELSLTLLSGIFGSAFCASLQHYFLEVRPLLRDLPLPIFNWLEGVLIEKEKEFDVIHPVSPVALPNFVQGLEGQLRYGSPEGITEAETLRFMDAGAELNIPYYPLLRREVDCIIALDASADSQDLWFTRAEEYAARRGLRTWPKGARWPKILRPSEESDPTAQQEQEVADTASKANERIASTKEADIVGQASHQQATHAPMGDTSSTKSQSSPSNGVPEEAGSQPEGQAGSDSKRTPDNEPENDGKPSSAYVWIGSSTDAGPSRVDKLDEEDLASRDGIGIVYMPLIPNEEARRRHGGNLWDPMHISTWRLELQREETEKLLTTAEMNFKDGHQKIVRVLRVMWMRRRKARLEREHQVWKRNFDRLVEHST